MIPRYFMVAGNHRATCELLLFYLHLNRLLATNGNSCDGMVKLDPILQKRLKPGFVGLHFMRKKNQRATVDRMSKILLFLNVLCVLLVAGAQGLRDVAISKVHYESFGGKCDEQSTVMRTDLYQGFHQSFGCQTGQADSCFLEFEANGNGGVKYNHPGVESYKLDECNKSENRSDFKFFEKGYKGEVGFSMKREFYRIACTEENMVAAQYFRDGACVRSTSDKVPHALELYPKDVGKHSFKMVRKMTGSHEPKNEFDYDVAIEYMYENSDECLMKGETCVASTMDYNLNATVCTPLCMKKKGIKNDGTEEECDEAYTYYVRWTNVGEEGTEFQEKMGQSNFYILIIAVGCIPFALVILVWGPIAAARSSHAQKKKKITVVQVIPTDGGVKPKKQRKRGKI